MPRGGPAELIGESATSPPRSSQQALRHMRKSERASRCYPDCKVMVARDGIEPPTPAFSGPYYLVLATTYMLL